MNFDLEIGQRVSLLDEAISGLITGLEGERVYIQTDDEFEIVVFKNEIVPDKKLDIRFNSDFNAALEQKNAAYKRKKKPTNKIKGIIPPMEVDLHIHQLTANERGMSAYDKLNLQLDVARSKLEFAISKRIQRIVFIHGVGEGVLRAELEYLFSRYEQIKFYDADFQKYGLGATEVYIYQNVPPN
ncbi:MULTISPECIES: Smr/MutS family protein [unclassified Leeuwenhoekiella]|uniref:Smr/MutS family protein n=1 Tax=unclassified Leeuwenhoekiella TaxID=2615029 RepID=UPI000C428F2F|nr:MULTISPECIES: Smr/MutS family protein [unclassified Leeuwenhoekiella]MAW94592.1 DNA mismatch repair protein MutS [Leeuwenhoekiella sp.]MBA82015.1 DNA mismatch repair protein MutS [Leeuwenhoekiella sp.]|tara:strand:+ start:5717 stop:6271 length:555 start_codon:yes stop_codon:yes gene_type:complete